jgi:outer membrane immunogenic protein
MRRLSIIFVAALSTVAFTNIASAADMVVKAPVYKAPPPAPYNWNGFYVGGNAGYGWSNASFNMSGDNDAGTRWLGLPFFPDPSLRSGTFDTSGFVGGAQVGFNWQFNSNWVAGFETDFNYADLHGTASIPSFFTYCCKTPSTLDVDSQLKWFGTVRGRLGFLPTERLLIFATGGLAYGKIETNAGFQNNSGTFSQGVLPDGSAIICLGNSRCISGNGSRTSVGWTLGGGLEWAFANNWSIKAEYLYMNLGDETIHMVQNLGFIPPKPGSIAVSFDNGSYQIVRGGLNYRF